MTLERSTKGTVFQASVIPFRFVSDRIEFCVVTSIRKKKWIFPKGIIDPGETPTETALKEAFEEAGLHGHIVGDPLGVYDDEKWGARLAVQAYLMEVTRCDHTWFEMDVRDRRWGRPEEIFSLLSKPALLNLLHQAMARLTSE